MGFFANALKSDRIKRALYASGGLEAWHRRRNRERLTVITFHRVLPRDDPRWATSDPEYTLPLDLFTACLPFFRQHYDVVSLHDVLDGRQLPERPLLITFDDGWSDTEEYALPALREHDLPAVVFVVSDAVDRRVPFWQEQLIAGWRAGRLDAHACTRTWDDVRGELPPPAFAAAGRDDLDPIRELITALEHADVSVRARVLDELATRLDDGARHMITGEQVRRLADAGVAIGAHGQTHAPLTRVSNVDAELVTARRALEDHLGGTQVAAMSCPHGSWDERVLAGARAAGYRRVFTSVPELSAPDAEVLGRVGFTAETISGGDGRFAPERLALHLFRKPHARSSRSAAAVSMG